MGKGKRVRRLAQLARLREYLPLPSGPTRLQDPLDVAHAFVKAWNAGDAKAIAELFAEDADFVNVVGLWWTSRRSIRRAHKRGFEQIFRASEISVEKLTLRMLGTEAAVVHARWRMSAQLDPQGRPSTGGRRGVITWVLQRLADGTWICVSSQNTDIAPAADTNLNVAGVVTPTSYLAPAPVDPVEPTHP